MTGAPSLARAATAVTMLAVLTIIWAALPVAAGAAGVAALTVAVVCAAAGTVCLTAGDVRPASAVAGTPLARLSARVARMLRTAPWSEAMTVAVLTVEALHHDSPWHTGVLGAALLAYLFAAHLTETRARPAALRPAVPVIAAGLGLLTLAVGASALPQPHAGPASELLRVLAVTAAVVTAALALPTRPR